MPAQNSRFDDLDPKIADQVSYIISAFDAHGIPLDYVTAPHEPGERYAAGVSYIYASNQLLVRDRYITQIRNLLSRRFKLTSPTTEPVIGDIAVLGLGPASSGDDHEKAEGEERPTEEASSAGDDHEEPEGEERPTEEASSEGDECDEAGHRHSEGEPPCLLTILGVIEKEFGQDAAALNQVVTVAGGGGDMGPCPATEPQEVYAEIEPYPGVCWDNGGAGVRIWIADTGLLDGAAESHPWLNGVEGEPDPRTGPDGKILPYAGHGTFVAGVVRCMAPEASIYVANVFNIAGSALESSFVPKLHRAFSYGAQIIHLTISTLTRKNLPLRTVAAWMEVLRQYKGVACVVAAGNDGTNHPSWPAAFPGMIAVGALAADWRNRADFSNYGGWVDVYAPGRDLINAYATGTYKCRWAPYKDKEREFYGMARWSGTSFSTPIVTGLIAARMARCGESGHEAAAALLARARAQTIPGVGPVLLPCCGDNEGCGCACGCGCGDACGCGGQRRGGGCGDGCGMHHHRMAR